MQLIASVAAGSNPPATVEYLVIGGGAGSGVRRTSYFEGGGGAGQVKTSASFAVASGTALTVTIGTGGANAVNGASSVFSSVTSVGGSFASDSFGGTSGNGFSGGSPAGAAYGSGAGGGSTGNGASATSNAGASGGAGTTSSINGTSTVYAIGGGTLGGWVQGNAGSGGGITGGGGFANGSNGVVIIAYSTAFDVAAATTGSPTYSSASRSGFHVYTFTGSGSITF